MAVTFSPKIFDETPTTTARKTIERTEPFVENTAAIFDGITPNVYYLEHGMPFKIIAIGFELVEPARPSRPVIAILKRPAEYTI